jgi:hypothetical protein
MINYKVRKSITNEIVSDYRQEKAINFNLYHEFLVETIDKSMNSFFFFNKI